MSKQTRDGGPAFPSHGNMGEVTHEGMTLRDYFAAKADLGQLKVNDMAHAEKLVGRPLPDGPVEQLTWQADLVASCRYIFADAMLRAREQGEPK